MATFFPIAPTSSVGHNPLTVYLTANVGNGILPPPGTDGSGFKWTFFPINPLPGFLGAGSYAMQWLIAFSLLLGVW